MDPLEYAGLGVAAAATVQIIKQYTRFQGLLVIVLVLLVTVLFSIAYVYGWETPDRPALIRAVLRGIVAGFTAMGFHSAAKQVQGVAGGGGGTPGTDAELEGEEPEKQP